MSRMPDPNYDLRDALYSFAPGVLPTREIDDALAARYAANNYTPLTEDQVIAITGEPPEFPSTLPWIQPGCA